MPMHRSDAAGPSIPPDSAAPRPVRKMDRRLKLTGWALLVSALVFCVVVVYQRDESMRASALRDAERVAAGLRAYIADHSAIPHPGLFAADPGIIGATTTFVGPASVIPYPTKQEVLALRGRPGPYVLVTGPRQGLITPGADGAAAILYEAGNLRVRWLSAEELRIELNQRRALLEPPGK